MRVTRSSLSLYRSTRIEKLSRIPVQTGRNLTRMVSRALNFARSRIDTHRVFCNIGEKRLENSSQFLVGFPRAVSLCPFWGSLGWAGGGGGEAIAPIR